MLAQRKQALLCGVQSESVNNAQLKSAFSLLRRRAQLPVEFTFIGRRIFTFAVPSTSSLIVDPQPSYGPQLHRSQEADGTTRTDIDPPSAASDRENTSAQVQNASEVLYTQAESSILDRRKLWFAAIKPPMYSVGFVPVLVAAANVFFEFGVLPWGRVAGFVFASILVIAWLNLSNDAFDAQTGVDVSKPESVVNLLGGGSRSHTIVLLLAKSLLLTGIALLAHLITSAPGGDLRPAGLLAFSIACGYVYQGPPFRLSYKGLGEPLCFFAFGPSALTAFYLALRPETIATTAATPTATATAATAIMGSGGDIGSLAANLAAGVPPAVWTCSVLVGLTTTVILFCSHFHQIAGDTAAGKRSPLVRLGTEQGRKVLRAAAAATQLAVPAAAAAGLLPWAAAAATVLAAPAARSMVAFADEHHLVPSRVAPLKRFGVTWHIQFGLCLCVGLAAARLLARAA